jgi:hypothetical protein
MDFEPIGQNEMGRELQTLDTLVMLLDLDGTDMEFLETYVAALECSNRDCVSRLLVELKRRPSEALRHGPRKGVPQFARPRLRLR